MKVRRDIYRLQRYAANRLEREAPSIRLYNTPESDAVPYAHLVIIEQEPYTANPIHAVCASVADVKWLLWYFYNTAAVTVERALAADGCIRRADRGLRVEIVPILPIGLYVEESPQPARGEK